MRYKSFDDRCQHSSLEFDGAQNEQFEKEPIDKMPDFIGNVHVEYSRHRMVDRVEGLEHFEYFVVVQLLGLDRNATVLGIGVNIASQIVKQSAYVQRLTNGRPF